MAQDQKLGFQLLNRLVQLWVPAVDKPAGAVNGVGSTPVPGFEQFLYENALKMCFELPMQKTFDFSDAVSFMVRRPLPSL